MDLWGIYDVQNPQQKNSAIMEWESGKISGFLQVRFKFSAPEMDPHIQDVTVLN